MRFRDYVPLPYILSLIMIGALRVAADFLHDLDHVTSIQGETLQFLPAFLFSCVSLTAIFPIISARDIRIGFFVCTVLVLLRHVL